MIICISDSFCIPISNLTQQVTNSFYFYVYRPLGNYYTEYHTQATTPYMGNSFLDIGSRAPPVQCSGLPTYDQLTAVTTATVGVRECGEKLYGSPPVVSMDHHQQQHQQHHQNQHHQHHHQQQLQQQQHQTDDDNMGKCHMDAATAAAAGLQPYLLPLCDVQFRTKNSSPPVANGLKIEDVKSEYGMQSSDSDVPRQTVLMWGTCVGDSSSLSSPPNGQSPGGGGGGGNGSNNSNGGGGGGVNGSGGGTGGGSAGANGTGAAGVGTSVAGNGSGSGGGAGTSVDGANGDPRTSPQANGHPPSPYVQQKKMSPPAPPLQPPTSGQSDPLCKSRLQTDTSDTPPSPSAAAAAASVASAYANHHHHYQYHHHQQHHLTGGPEVWTSPQAHPPPPPPHHFYAYHHHQ